MASTYSDRLKLELMETGANANTWGNNTNTNLQTVDAFSAGYLSKSVAGSSNVTLTTNNADPTAEASNKVLDLNGTLTANIHVFMPAVENNYVIYNNTSGSFTLTVAATGHAANGVAITQGAYSYLYCDGASNYNVKNIFSDLALEDVTLSGNLTVTGNANISTNVTVTGTMTAGTVVETSSIAYKENIRSLDSTTEAILSMDPVIYDRKDGSQKNEVGLIAEEVYKIAPELVHLKDGNPEGIKYTKLAVYLLHAIKDLKKDLDMLKKRQVKHMANLTSTTITGTLNTTSTITGPASGASALNASNVSSGTLASDRLPTVPTSKGGTGLTSIGSAGQVLKVASPGSALEYGDAGGGGGYEMLVFTSSGTHTKDTGLAAVKVTVIGGGGGGGSDSPSGNAFSQGGGRGGIAIETIQSPSIPGPVSVTVGAAGNANGGNNPGSSGGTTSYGSFLSASGGGGGGGGSNGETANNGTGSGGQINGDGVNYTEFNYYGRNGAGGGRGNNEPGNAGEAGFVLVEEFY